MSHQTPDSSGRRRLKVLHMIGVLTDAGGAERFLAGLALHLPRDRFESWVCAPRGADPVVVERLAAAGIPFVDFGRRSKWDMHRTAKLAELLARERFDVVHTHLFGSNMWGSVFARAFRVPVVVAHEHTWSYRDNRMRMWLDGFVIGRLVDRFIAVSRADAEKMVRIERVPAERIEVIPSAYVPRAPSPPLDLRAELGLAPGTPLIGIVCVMRPQKALEVLLAAHRRVLEQIPDAHLILAGDGSRRRALEAHALELGIALQTHFLGRRSDIDAILRALDVAAMSSDYEGAPLFVYECMDSGTPLVATAVGGLPEVVDSGRTGLLVPPRAPDALAEAIVSLLTDRGRAAALAAAAAERLAPFRIEVVAGRIAALYEELFVAATRRHLPARLRS